MEVLLYKSSLNLSIEKILIFTALNTNAGNFVNWISSERLKKTPFLIYTLTTTTIKLLKESLINYILGYLKEIRLMFFCQEKAFKIFIVLCCFKVIANLKRYYLLPTTFVHLPLNNTKRCFSIINVVVHVHFLATQRKKTKLYLNFEKRIQTILTKKISSVIIKIRILVFSFK